MKRKLLMLVALMAVLCWLPGQAMAASITVTDVAPVQSFSASGTDPANSYAISAKAIFTLNTTLDTLTIQLINTATAATDNVPSNILTGLFFTPSNTLSPSSASVNGSLVGGTITDPTLVGGYWQYKAGVSLPNSATAGISSAGLGVFGPDGNFGGTAEKLDGLNGFEIAPIGFTGSTNADVKGATLVVHEVDFILNVPADLTSLTLSNLSFQYGTGLEKPNIVPLPGAILLLGAGMVRLVAYARRRKEE